MAENQNQTPQPEKKRFRFGSIIIAVLVIGLFIMLFWNMFVNMGVSTFSTTGFEREILGNKDVYITSITGSPYTTNIVLEGQAVDFSVSEKPVAIKFKVEYLINSFENEKSLPALDLANAGTNTQKEVDLSADFITVKARLDEEVKYSSATDPARWQKYEIDQKLFGVVYNQKGYEPSGMQIFMQMFPYIIMIGIAIFMGISLSRTARAAGQSNDQAMSFNNSRARRVSKSRVKFADVAGADEEKAELVEVVQYLQNPKKFTDFGAKLPKGILLVGPPGTGKTLIAKATAGEAEVPFFSISGSDFVEMFVGVGAGRVRDMFKQAKQNAPCIIFIDEIDAVGRQRGAGLGGGNDEREQTLNQLLVEMDGFSDNSGIIIIAATNREDVLDPALLRAGRFDRQITMNLPDRAGREAIFKVHARNKTFAPDVDFNAISRRTVGFSGADIENILNEAAILAVRENAKAITTAHIDEAIDRRIAGPAKKSAGMNLHERRTVAYHEAGHAIIGLKLEHSDKVQKITIIPRGRTGGHVLMTPEDDRFLLTKKEIIARIIGYLGGRSSEEIFFDDVSTGAQNDIEVATRLARLMVTEFGMSSLGPIQYEKDTGSVFLGRDYTQNQKNFSGRVADEIDREVRTIIENAHNEAKRIITENREDVILLAETLLEKETITAEEIDYLLKNRKLPEAVSEIVPVVEESVDSGNSEEPQEEVVVEAEETTVEEASPSKKPASATKKKTPTTKKPPVKKD